ncbi:hypothetical protein V2I21_08150 [Campylobacter sp. CLAX-22107-21]|uniref:hypothetical protein n=1 Tax=Campylobacter devanensis TaxID=3161138 RepID=UPI002EC21E50|nr:hypothetical protein [Campylobacter sp. CLAX-22107-21]
MHRFLANYYGLNIIDIQEYYQNNEIIQFGNKFGTHQLAVLNRNVSKEIAKNIDIFKISKKSFDINMPEYKIVTPENMQRNGNFKIFNPNNSMYNEIVYRLEKGNSLAINNCDGYQIIGMHSWNLENNGEITKLNWVVAATHCGSIYLKNINQNIVKQTSKLKVICEIQAELVINNEVIVKFNDENLPNTEFYEAAQSWLPNSVSLPYFDLISFFLCKPNPKMKLFDLSIIPSDIEIEIDKDIDRSYLIPNIVFFKDSMEFIDEYIGHLYPNITKHIDRVLTPQIINKTKPQPTPPAPKPTPQPTPQELEIKSLKDKLSQKEKDINNLDINHKKALTSQELEIKSLKEALSKKEKDISSLEINYQKALNTKNHLSYKLGAALIKANKNWYKGGYIKFIFEVIRINKEHKK